MPIKGNTSIMVLFGCYIMVQWHNEGKDGNGFWQSTRIYLISSSFLVL